MNARLLTIGERQTLEDRIRLRLERTIFFRNLFLLLDLVGAAVLLWMRG